MAKKKAAAAKARQKPRTPGKRLGVKKFGGQIVKTGQIIVRQRGTHFHSGDGTGLGRDYTIFAMAPGVVEFYKRQGKKYIRVV